MSFLEYPKVIPYTKFDTLGSFVFELGYCMLQTLAWKMHLLILWPCPLTLDHQNCTTSRVSQGHSLYQVWILWNHSFLSYAADKQTNKQTNKQTDSKILPTPTNIVGVGISLVLLLFVLLLITLYYCYYCLYYLLVLLLILNRSRTNLLYTKCTTKVAVFSI